MVVFKIIETAQACQKSCYYENTDGRCIIFLHFYNDCNGKQKESCNLRDLKRGLNRTLFA